MVCVAGVDEVGRGCLAGPVVAAAVVLPAGLEIAVAGGGAPGLEWLAKVNDSKLLSAEEREELAPLIRGLARAYCIAQASVAEIDRINIYHASHLAMLRALQGLVTPCGETLVAHHVLVDGNRVPQGLPSSATAIVKGDSRSISIACASIIAKVHRDQMMVELDRKYPGYGLAVHKGYSTPQHQAALKALGARSIHRKSFAPVREALKAIKTSASDSTTLSSP